MKKKEGNWFFRILTILFIIYVALFIANQTGYYEKSVRDKTLLTAEKIIQFEKDVADNKTVDIISYLPEKEDYSNFWTKGANKLANSLSNVLDDDFNSIWHFLKSLFIS